MGLQPLDEPPENAPDICGQGCSREGRTASATLPDGLNDLLLSDDHVPAPRTVAVIVNYNGGGLLARSVDGVRRQRTPFDRIIVVDNASTDASAEGLPEDVEVIRPGANLGFASGNNLGVAFAPECDWIALINPDAFLAEDWLERMHDGAAQTGAAALGCQLLNDLHPDLLDGAGDAVHTSGLAWRVLHGSPRELGPQAVCDIFSPCAAAALYRRSTFDEVGGFEERFFCYFEDIDLAYRLRLAGYHCAYVPAAVARHVGSASSGRESDFTIYHSHRNLVWTYVRDSPSPLRHLPQHIVMSFFTIVWFSGRGQAGPILRAKRDALRGLPWALRERRRIQGARRATVDEVRHQLVGGLGAYRTAWSRAWQIVRPRNRKGGKGT